MAEENGVGEYALLDSVLARRSGCGIDRNMIRGGGHTFGSVALLLAPISENTFAVTPAFSKLFGLSNQEAYAEPEFATCSFVAVP